MTLAELAAFMARLGADSAINLDGGASASLVSSGVLVNNPREPDGGDVVGGRAVHTATTFTARS